MNSIAKTKKTKKIKKSPHDLKELWSSFDNEIGSSKKPLECLYSSSVREFCDTCNSNLFYNDENYLTCSNLDCGIIYKDTLDQSAEWRYYGSSDNKSVDPTRCGLPINPLLKESSYGCQVSCHFKSTYEMRKIRRYTEWQSMPYKEKTRYDEFERIKIMAHNSGIPKIIVDSALRYHKQISDEKTFRGLNRDGIIAASIYISCRINKFPRTAKELAVIFHLDTSSATKGCKNAVTILNDLEKNKNNNEKTQLCKTTPFDFIERYCSRLNYNKQMTKICQFIAMKIDKDGLIPENTPHSVAAGVIYFIADLCKLNITKKDVNRVSEISEVTINKCFKKLVTLKNSIVPPTILNKYE
tara:strand:+ start:3352 stop:4416 length:1065 start_codon:yes stop_codon:yes gene_type:complete